MAGNLSQFEKIVIALNRSFFPHFFPIFSPFFPIIFPFFSHFFLRQSATCHLIKNVHTFGIHMFIAYFWTVLQSGAVAVSSCLHVRACMSVCLSVCLCVRACVFLGSVENGNLEKSCSDFLDTRKKNLTTTNNNSSADFLHVKETTLERVDFTLQLLMFVTAEKERRMFIIFFISSFCQRLSPRFYARKG